jgi:hypothetical protein
MNNGTVIKYAREIYSCLFILYKSCVYFMYKSSDNNEI